MTSATDDLGKLCGETPLRRRGDDRYRQKWKPLAADERLADYQPYWAARGAILARAGRTGESREALTRALGLADDPAVRTWLRARIEALPLDG